MLAGNVVTNTLLVVTTASAPNCWKNGSKEDAGLAPKTNVDVNRAVQAGTFNKNRIHSRLLILLLRIIVLVVPGNEAIMLRQVRGFYCPGALGRMCVARSAIWKRLCSRFSKAASSQLLVLFHDQQHIPATKQKLQAVFDESVYAQLQELSEATGKNFSLLTSELVVEALEARRAGADGASAIDHLKQALNLLQNS